jgi:hypothetical protein
LLNLQVDLHCSRYKVRNELPKRRRDPTLLPKRRTERAIQVQRAAHESLRNYACENYLIKILYKIRYLNVTALWRPSNTAFVDLS